MCRHFFPSSSTQKNASKGCAPLWPCSTHFFLVGFALSLSLSCIYIYIKMTRHNQNGMADREPCPWRIVDDVGGAFCMGAIGGTVWHSVRGAWVAPAGSRLQGSLSAVQARSPVLGGQFAVWGGIFACCDCTLTAVRQKVSFCYYCY